MASEVLPCSCALCAVGALCGTGSSGKLVDRRGLWTECFWAAGLEASLRWAATSAQHCVAITGSGAPAGHRCEGAAALGEAEQPGLWVALCRDAGLHILAPGTGSDAADAQCGGACEALGARHEEFLLAQAWERAMHRIPGDDWTLGCSQLPLVSALVLEVDSFIPARDSYSFRLVLEGFDPEDVTDMFANERDHIFSLGMETVHYPPCAVDLEVFLAAERSPADRLELFGMIGSLDHVLSEHNLAPLRPLTFHLIVALPLLGRICRGSMTVGPEWVLGNYARMALGEFLPHAAPPASPGGSALRDFNMTWAVLLVEP